MEIKTAIKEAIRELILPELAGMKADIQELKTGYHLVNKRLDDMNNFMIDLIRRIDEANSSIDLRKTGESSG